MIFKIDRDVIQKKLSILQHNSKSKSVNPALSGILFELNNNKLTLTSTNEITSIKTSIVDSSLEVEKEGRILVPAQLFDEIIKKVNSKTVEFLTTDDNHLKISFNRANYKIRLLPHEDFPSNELSLNGDLVELEAKKFISLIEDTSYAAASNDKRPILKGVNFTIEGNSITAISTDSFRLSRKEEILEKEYGNFSFTIQAENINQISKSFPDSSCLKLYINDNFVIFYDEITLYKTALLEGNYPQTKHLIVEDYELQLVLNKKELSEAIDRVSLLSSREAFGSNISLSVTNDGLVHVESSNQELGNAKEEIYIVSKSASCETKINFNAKYLKDVLKKYHANEISLNLNGAVKPFTITSKETHNLLQLILPLRG